MNIYLLLNKNKTTCLIILYSPPLFCSPCLQKHTCLVLGSDPIYYIVVYKNVQKTTINFTKV